MNSEKKSLVEEALLQMKNLENVVSENAKGILASTMKEEIEELVKESLFEETDEEMMADESYNTEGTHMGMYEDEDEDSMTIDMTASDDAGDEMSMTDDITMMGDDDDMMGDEIEPLNMVGASDEELMKIVMGMGDDDRLIVQKMDDELDIDVLNQTDTMTFPLGGGEDLSEPSMDDDDSTDELAEEVVYEIEISDDDEDGMGDYDDEKEGMMESKEKTYVGVGMGKGPGKVSYKGENIHKGPHGKSAPEAKKYVKGEFKEGQGYDDHEDEKEGMKHGALSKKDLKSMKSRRDDAGFETREDEMKEASRTYGNGSRNYPERGLPKMKVVTNKALEEEVRVLRLKNEEYRKALNIFREKLNEVAVFNSNLAYATRLFTEHSTTKQEKINIMRRFDNVETIKESKNLYSQIKNELGGKETAVVKESIVESIDRTPTKGSTNLVENKTYENPQFLRMKDLMSKLNK
jgi:hypothetical protein